MGTKILFVKQFENLSGSCLIPKVDPSNIRGQIEDEQTLLKMFGSFDDNYDGQLQTKNSLRRCGMWD